MLDVNCFPLSCITLSGLPLTIIQSSSTLRTSTDLFLSDHLLATFLEQSSETANDVISFTRIAEIERAKYVHLYHIIGMFHGKSFVDLSYLGLTLEDVKTMSL